MTKQNQYAAFEGVEGYKTYENAKKRGDEVACEFDHVSFRWVVICLPNGRYAPMIILNQNVHGGPGMFLGHRNGCLCN